MTREEAIEMVKQKVSNKNLRKHMIATVAVMRKLAVHLEQDEDLWAVCGLLHDLDYDLTADDFPRHGLMTAEMLSETDLPEEAIYAIKSHPGHFPRKSLLDKALYAVDPVTGLIVAAALMHPTKKLKNLDVDFVMRRFNEKRFAAGANRDQIRSCGELGIELEAFVSLALESMQEIDSELGL